MAFNPSRVHLRRVNAAFAAGVAPGSLVLDAGAGEQPYRDLFAHCRYEAADFHKVDKPYAQSTWVCDLTAIPVEDGRFDAILFNQVMEHLPDPLAALRELRRVLRPGGQILCTCPLFYAEHEQPYDFYRYTQFAHRHLFTQAGFEVTAIDWLEGYYATAAYQFRMMARRLPIRPVRGAPVWTWPLTVALGVIGRPVAALLSAGLGRLDLVATERSAGMPKNYVVRARAI